MQLDDNPRRFPIWSVVFGGLAVLSLSFWLTLFFLDKRDSATSEVGTVKPQSMWYWQDSGQAGDCGANDWNSTQGATPNEALCGAERKGQIAICWDGVKYRANQVFCTYKTLTFDKCLTGTKPGKIYVCASQ